MLLFRSEEHVKVWCAAWNQPFGSLLSLMQAWGLAQAWYGEDRRQPAWRRKTAEQALEIFAGLGLASDFWRF